MNTNTSSPSSRKVVVIGGTGLVGKPLVARLRELGHTVIAASPSRSINAVTGEGLATALDGAHTVIDVSNSPSFEDAAVLDFFTRSTGNIIAAAKTAGVRHVLALSVVGADRIHDSGYIRAKIAQETLIKESGLPFTLVRATQFFEFAAAIAYVATVGNEVRVPRADMQPIAAADVSATLAKLALGTPANTILDLAGPEKITQAAFLRRELSATGDSRTVVEDDNAGYFGARIARDSLVPVGTTPILAPTQQADWLAKRAAAPATSAVA